jgi:hypothetical protein
MRLLIRLEKLIPTGISVPQGKREKDIAALAYTSI